MLLLLCALLSFTPPEDQEVGRAEVIRRGDMIEHVTNEIEDADPLIMAISQITAEVPKIDNEKFHLSVIAKDDGTCPACINLHKQWETDKILRAYAIPDSPKDSWAHFTWYDYNDKLQQWRWTPSAHNPNPIKITRFPTIILQPPLNGTWGNPQTVIFKYVYEGDPHAFSKSLNRALKEYVATYQNKQGLRRAGSFARPPKAPAAIPGGIGQATKVRPPDAFTPGPIGGIRQPDPVPPPEDDTPMAGDQEIPPLVIPNDTPDEEEEAPSRPLLDMFQKPTIIVMRDRDQRDKAETELRIDSLVESLQTKYGGNLVEKQLDVSKYGKVYGVTPEEVPAVLVVQGKKVREKLIPDDESVDQPKGSVLLVYMILSTILGTGAKVVFMSRVIHWVLVLILVLGLVIGFLFLCLMGALLFRPRTQPGLTPQQQLEILKASAAAKQQ